MNKTSSVFFNSKFFTKDSKEYSFMSKSGYLDYIKRKEASAKAAIDSLDKNGLLSNKESKSFMGYMKNRNGSTAIYDKSKMEVKDWKGIKKIHKDSNVWTWVVSFDKDTTLKYNIDKIKWDVARKTFKAVMDSNQLNANDFHFQAAFHTNTSHHHLHFRVYQPEDSKNIRIKGKFKKNTHLHVKYNVSGLFVENNFETNEIKKEIKQKIANYIDTCEDVSHEISEIRKNITSSSGRFLANINPEDLERVQKLNERVFKESSILSQYNEFIKMSDESWKDYKKSLVGFIKTNELNDIISEKKLKYIKEIPEYSLNKILDRIKKPELEKISLSDFSGIYRYNKKESTNKSLIRNKKINRDIVGSIIHQRTYKVSSIMDKINKDIIGMVIAIREQEQELNFAI